jgi:cytochrome b6-f complex iron-sulfur subunit
MNEKPKPEIGRRSFLDYLLGFFTAAWATTVVYPIYEFFQIPPKKEDLPDSIVAAKFEDLKPNQGIIFKFGSKPGLLILGTDGTLRAFSAVCTHLDCTVKYQPELQKIHCACHNGLYDLNGQVISGPPPRPLDQYTVVQKGDDVIVSRV